MTLSSEPTTLYTSFRRSADRHPDAVALEVGDERLEYAALLGLVESVAARLRRARGGRPRAVGLCCERSLAAYAGYLAALRAGATVVPLNPTFPVARNRAMSVAARTDVVVVDDAGAAQAREVAGATSAPVVQLTGDEWRDDDADDPSPYDARPDDVAYVLFTSGSTGRPKGVPIRHLQLADYLPLCVDRYEVGPGSRLSQTFDLTFDPSVFDMFVAWSAGAALVVPSREDVLTPARFVERHAVTHWFSVPSVISLARRLRNLTPGSMPTLRWSLFAGEKLTLERARDWAEAAPNSVVENLYGPTELTITCTAYRLARSPEEWPATSNATVPIGSPYPHLEAIVVDDDGRVAETGELCVRGSQRFGGYLDARDDEGRFVRFEGGVTTPAAGASSTREWYRTGDRVRWDGGELVHLGRLDDQVKVRGIRIELSEVEAVLRRHAGVHDVVVLADEGDGRAVELHALYTGDAVVGDDLRRHAAGLLPAAAVPSSLVHVPEFPVNANGKTDRHRLRREAARNGDHDTSPGPRR